MEEFTGWGARTEADANAKRESLERIDRDRVAAGTVRYEVREHIAPAAGRHTDARYRKGYRVYRVYVGKES